LPCKVNLIPYNPIIDTAGQPLAPIKEVKRGRLAALRGGQSARRSSKPKPFEPQDFRTPSQERIDSFREYLYPRCPAVTLRTPKGRSIAAACGQLVAQVQRFETAV
jgi:adenine C2-methylase RlmN of 23S rRNA A2503 and tRNA A37